MSTKQIRDVLEIFRREASSLDSPRARKAIEALAEVEAIEKAAKVLEAEDLAGWTYDVRNRAASDPSFTGNTWKHPRVVAYGEAAQVITRIAKESAK